MLPRHRAVHVERAVAGGSSWPVVVRDDDDRRWLVKLRGAAQGTGPLVAEVVVAELAAALALPVPARAIVTVDAALTSADPHQELAELLAHSRGDNLGFAFLPDARAATADAVEPATAVRILWLDGLVGNLDRTARNPNLLADGDRLWLIDHGASLSFQYAWPAVTEASPQRPLRAREPHLLAAHAPALAAAAPALAALLTRDVLEAALAVVPDSFLAPLVAVATPDALARLRAAHVAYLWKRLRAPQLFAS